MPMTPDDYQLTPREAQLMAYEKEQLERSMAHEVTMKQLDIKWQQFYKIPLAILMLPVKMLAGVALIAVYITKKEPSQSFWSFLNK